MKSDYEIPVSSFIKFVSSLQETIIEDSKTVRSNSKAYMYDAGGIYACEVLLCRLRKIIEISEEKADE